MASLLFMDWETRSNSDLPVTGTLRYVLDPSTRPLLLSWAVDAGDLRLWCPDLSDELVPEVWAYVLGRMWCYGTGKARNGNGPPFKGVPAEIADLCARPDGYIVAFNCAFDRSVWQQIATPDYGFPRIEIEQTLDCMSQSQASNLPGSLEFAGRALGLGQKTVGGKAIMQRFARRQDPLPGSKADIENLMAKGLTREKAIAAAIEAWDLYLTYSVQDTALLRDVWNCTRPLDGTEWQEYWTSERINDRGMLADLDVCRGAVSYREEEALHVAAECERLTGGAINSPTLTKQINEWLYERLPEDLAAGMVKQRDEETGEATRLTGAKDVMTRLLEDIQTSDTPPSDDVTEFVELLQFGRSSSAVKFEKILNQEVDGRLSGSYVFNGAGQTGRYSSRGVQVHNLPRAYLENELDVLDMVAAGVPIDRLREIGPVSSVLAKLIRPTFIAPPDKMLVWGDWSAIEARVNPWLAKTRDADEAVLAPFRQSDTDPDAADLYVLNAAAIFHISEDVIWERYKNGDKEAKGQRQAGKVACIAEGQLVLTDIGLVPIEGVTLDMKVWDGQSFVSHQGSMFMGYKDVWEYDGLTATLDHIVWTEEAGETRFGEAIRRGYHNVKSGASRAPIRVGGDHLAGAAVPTAEVGGVLRSVSLHGVRGREVHLPRQPAAREIEGLPALHTAAPDTEMAGSKVNRSEVALHQPKGPGVEMVRRTRGRVPVLVGAGSRAVDPEELGPARGLGDRPHRQLERALRSGEPALGDRASAAIEQTRFEARGELGVHPERVAVRQAHDAPQIVERVYARGDHPAGARRSIGTTEGVAYYRGKVAVYDIANAGPLHRFTVSDCLVHNCLALGFLGSVGALKAMARGYGMRLNDEEARLIVDGWRDRNRWARRFGDKCEEAAFSALSHPLQMYPAGRLTYQFVPGLMGGTLVCFLPDGRPIVYPKAKIKKVEKFGHDVDAITYLNGMGYRALWNGLMIENGTQATAASILRQTLVRVEAAEPDVLVGHTHDEVIGEVPTTMAGGFAERLEAAMVAGFDWTEGLPLAAEVSTNWYYTKSS